MPAVVEFVPTLLVLSGMHLLMAMLPGPNTVVVSWLSATRSRRDGLLAAAGVAVASLAWVVFALGGLGALLLEAGWLYRLLRFAGALYLVFVGIRMLRSGLFPAQAGMSPTQPATRLRGPFAAGLTMTLSNPKSAIFWTSAFLVAVPPHAPSWVYAAIVVIVAIQSMLWYGGMAVLFSTGFARRRYFGMSRYLDLIAGSIMTALGFRMVDEVRRELVAPAG